MSRITRYIAIINTITSFYYDTSIDFDMSIEYYFRYILVASMRHFRQESIIAAFEPLCRD